MLCRIARFDMYCIGRSMTQCDTDYDTEGQYAAPCIPSNKMRSDIVSYRIEWYRIESYRTFRNVPVIRYAFARQSWEYLLHIEGFKNKSIFFRLPAGALATPRNSEAQDGKTGGNSLPHVRTYWARTIAHARRANSRREPEQIFPGAVQFFRVFACETCEKCLALFYFFHVLRILTFHERVSRASAGKPKCWESSNICGRTLAPRA